MRTAVIHHLIQYLIDETELLLHVVFGDLAIAVCLADEDELVKKLNRHGSIHVGLGGGQEDEVLIGDGDVADSIEEQDRVITIFLGGDHLRAVVLDLGTSDVVLEGTVDQDLTLDVYEHHGTQHLNYYTWIQIRSRIIIPRAQRMGADRRIIRGRSKNDGSFRY